jgi:hypothetical protein
MSVTLDGQKLFDEQGFTIEAGSLSRDSIERSAAGVDGVLSIDLGQRARTITQEGVLRAKSRLEMQAKIDAISACIDGGTHKLITGSGGKFDDLRMDSFEVTKERTSGSGLCYNYEIIYKQLVA